MTQENHCQMDQINIGPENVNGFEWNSPGQYLLYMISAVWNRAVKPGMAKIIHRTRLVTERNEEPQQTVYPLQNLQAGDMVRVRSKEEIYSTLDFEKKFHGCTFLDCMGEYCGTTQRVYKPMIRFLDERDFKFKKTRGIVLLENVFCDGNLVFGHCDRSCFLFWREEWLEKMQ